MSARSDAGTRIDHLLGGRVVLEQPVKGYRAGLDAVVLAASLTAAPGDHVLDLGAGAGAVALCAAARLPGIVVAGWERDPAFLALAQANAARAGGSVCFEGQDVARPPSEAENAFDAVLCNPPYFEPDRLPEVGAGKAASHRAETPLLRWVKSAHHCLKPKAPATFIHTAGALGDLLAAMDSRFGEISVFPLWPRPGRAARRILVRGRKGLRRGPVTLTSGLVLMEAGKYQDWTAAADAILKGGALDWDGQGAI